MKKKKQVIKKEGGQEDYIEGGLLTKNRLILIIVLFLLGIFGSGILGIGITGKIIYDETVKSLCVSNDECNNEVCCLFYEESVGVCHEEKYCSLIEDITKQEKNSSVAIEIINRDIPKGSDNYLFSIILGFSVTLAVGIILYFVQRKFSNQNFYKR